jgi:4-amino-4-deoxy-L-arabinose transferase-like glycosyltransferase
VIKRCLQNISPLTLILIFAALIRSITFFIPHVENDEVVYTSLSKQLVSGGFSLYSHNLMGTKILEVLPKRIYETPLFFHPPVYPYLLALSGLAFGALGYPLVSFLSGLMIVYLTYLVACNLFDNRVAILSALIVTVCPVGILSSTRVWMEGTMVVFGLAALYFVTKAKVSSQDFLVAGVFFTLGFLTKYPLALFLPLLCWFVLRHVPNWRQRLIHLGIFGIPMIVISLWLWFFYSETGVLLLSSAPTAVSLATFPLVKEAFERPFYFYFTQLLLVSPIYALGFIGFLKSRAPDFRAPLVAFVFLVFVAMTFLGIGGHCKVMRHVLIGLPILAMLSAVEFNEESWVHRILFSLSIVYSGVVGVYSALAFGNVDVLLMI